MRNAISGGFRQAAGLRGVLAPVLTALVILLSLVDPVLRTYRDSGYFSEGFHISLLIQGFQSDSLSTFLPILAVLPFCGSFVDDVKTKFARFFLVRTSYGTYAVSRVIVAFFTGGLAILLGALGVWGVVAAVLIPMERPVEWMEPESPRVLVELCVLLFLNGGLWSVVGLAMSTLMESKYIAYASPFVLYYLLVILCEQYVGELFLLYPKCWLTPDRWPFGVWGAAIFFLEVAVLFGILFVIRATRRVRSL